MKPLQLARRYMDIFYSGEQIEALMDILAEQCHFKGPLYEFYTSRDYVSSLLKDPPKNMSYQELSALECGNSACIIYQFVKGSIETPMCQYFIVGDGKIIDILLIFDTHVFLESDEAACVDKN